MSEYPTHLIRRIRHKAFGAEERIVLFVLADRMKSTSDAAWPKVETIALDCGLTERTVRAVLSWMIAVGIVLVWRTENETDGARALKINFELLGSIPDNFAPRSSGTRKAASERSPVPLDRKRAHVDRNGAHPETSSQPGTGLHLTGSGRMSTGAPFQKSGAPCPQRIQEGTNEGTMKEPISATVPARSEVPIGAPLVLDFGQTDPSTPSTNAATPERLPGTLGASVESLPVDAANPPPKGKGKASKKPVRKLTDAQLEARDIVYAFWKKTYLDECGVDPIVGNAEVGQMVQLLKKVDWNSATVCALIKNAFTDVLFRERIKTIGNITANPSRYQQAANGRPSLSTSQMPTGKKDYGC